jgi:hypothetical protein
MSQQPQTQTHTDQSFGQTAVGLGYVTDTQVQECIKIQATMHQMGLDEHLVDLLRHGGRAVRREGRQKAVDFFPGLSGAGAVGDFEKLGQYFERQQVGVPTAIVVGKFGPGVQRHGSHIG